MLGLATVFLVVMPSPKSVAAPCDAPVSSEIACENSKPGTPQDTWDISGAGSSAIEGFATDISVNRGSTIGFKVKTASSNYTMNIYRMGYYGGDGARLQGTIKVTTKTTQPACASTSSSSTGLIDCGNWTQTASWAVPSDAVSGVYFAHLISGTDENHIFFIVRNDASTSDVLFQTSDTTWQAYNSWGGKSLYLPSLDSRAYKVSYNRPFNTRGGSDTRYDFVFNAEYPAIRYLEANGYDMSYTTGVDSARRGNLIKNHKTFLSVGHDEYWSGEARTNVEAARDAGVNMMFWSGNEVFWKTRWENSSASATSYRNMVTYKETATGTKTDPNSAWTGTWRDARLSPPYDGGRPENSLTGTLFTVNCCTTDMYVDGVDGQMRAWRNTDAAKLSGIARRQLGEGILGYEWDESPDNGFRPAGLINLSTTSENVSSYLQDEGWNYAAGHATHHLTLYRAASGALVFGTGSVQWAWGLDNVHDNAGAVTDDDKSGGTADKVVRQLTMNLLADMGAQPATRQSDLVAATASNDTTPPTSTITAPAAGATIPVGQPVTISGTATDVGGKVGGVEVSTDGGTSWHPADGRASWSYTFTPGANGTMTIKSRATDDSVRTETPGAGRTVTVGSGGSGGDTCKCTVFAASSVPKVAADPDTGALELGMKFRSSKAGYITGIRFYKAASNTGSHTGTLWNYATGQSLGSVSFSNESASGWQQADFSGSGKAIAANTTYVVSYYAPNGHYAADDGMFASAINQTGGPLTGLQDGADGANGVYKVGAGMPTQAYAKSNYWVDAVFGTGSGGGTDTTKPTVTGLVPADGATGVATSATVSATFSEPVTNAKIVLTNGSGTAVAGTTTYDGANQRSTFTPSAALAAGTTYTVTVSGATDTAGNVGDPVTASFTTAAADVTAPSVTSRNPASGATGVATSTSVSATFDEPVSAAAISLKNGTTAVAGSTAYDSGTRTVTFTPSAALAASTTYTASVSGAKDAVGNTMTATSWSFTTAAAGSSGCPCSVFSTAAPSASEDSEGQAVELGMKFTSSKAGTVTAIRFYKTANNTGTHVGTLWSVSGSTGTKLGQVTFSNETGTGWQTGTLSTPVAISANTTYMVSYRTPTGYYAATERGFATAQTNGPLTGLANGTSANGVYIYSAKSAFPTKTFNASNYWVDVVMTAN